jgi:hypothetical protein
MDRRSEVLPGLAYEWEQKMRVSCAVEGKILLVLLDLRALP